MFVKIAKTLFKSAQPLSIHLIFQRNLLVFLSDVWCYHCETHLPKDLHSFLIIHYLNLKCHTQHLLEWTNSHQCTSWGWGRWSQFGDEPITHPPLPRVFRFFNFLSALRFFPPTYLPPPTYLTWFWLIPLPEFMSGWSGNHDNAWPRQKLEVGPK